MGQEPPILQGVVSALHSVAITRYGLTAAYVVCFYDWVISLDQEVAFIYSARWNSVKSAYIFCRYYPLAIAPFHIWGFLGDHEQHVCESYYHALYACIIPTILSAQIILMLRTYAFSGRKRTVLAVLSISFFGLVGVIIWVMSKQISLTLLFIPLKRASCFAISNQPTIGVVQVRQGSAVQPLSDYHLGIVSILTALFDGLNLFVMVRHCIRERGTLGPLGQSILKQGILVYIVATALNTLTIGAFFSSQQTRRTKSMVPWLAYTLPSVLSCRLVRTLRRKASPTETELRVEYSHMINEAIEMVEVEWHEETSEGFVPPISTDAQAQR